MPVSLTFYGGIGEIGGNKILLEDSGTKIFLDFGMNFSQYKKYYAEFIMPRKGAGIKDYFAMNLVPKIQGLYRDDILIHSGMKPESRDIDAILITHAHMDHASHLDLVKEEIPVYCSDYTNRIMKVFDETTKETEYTKVVPRFKFFKTEKGTTSRVTRKQEERERDIKVFQYNKPFKIGSVSVTPYQVDHSLPGATAYILETSEGNIVYTGDLRFHGRNPEKTEYFVEKAKESKPSLLITEGTRIKEKKSFTEEDVEKESSQHISKCTELAVINYPTRDLDRILTFYKISKNCERKMVVDFRQAFLLKTFEDTEVIPKLKDVLIYKMPKSWFLVNHPEAPKEQIPLDYDIWEREFLKAENTVSTDEIKRDQKEYLFFCSDFQLGNLLDIEPKNGSIYLNSTTEPFDEEMLLDKERKDRWLDILGIASEKRFQVHCSGHANGVDLRKMIGKIKAKKVIPIHTEFPQFFKKITKKTIFAKYGEKIILQ